jgi:hypothetical protein
MHGLMVFPVQNEKSTSLHRYRSVSILLLLLDDVVTAVKPDVVVSISISLLLQPPIVHLPISTSQGSAMAFSNNVM